MSTTDMPAAFAGEAAEAAAEAQAKRDWIATALTVLAAATAVLLASFVAVVTGLV